MQVRATSTRHRTVSDDTHWSAYKYNGADRIDNDLGHVPDNVVSSCEFCNKSRRDTPYLEYRDRVQAHMIRVGANPAKYPPCLLDNALPLIYPAHLDPTPFDFGDDEAAAA